MRSPKDEIPLEIKGVHRKILAALWDQKWVSTDRLLKLTSQGQFARRVRELRNEFGFPIEAKIKNGEYFYHLQSRHPKSPTRRRPYFTPSQKKEIVAKTGTICNICKQKPKDNAALMWDHRIPFNKGGETSAENGQLLCAFCNNLKRQACGICNAPNCENCLFSYPEIAQMTCVLGFDDRLWKFISEAARDEKLSPQEFIISLVKEKSEF